MTPSEKKIDFNSFVDVTSRLEKGQARKLLSEILNNVPNYLSYSKHGQDQMKARRLIAGDIINVLTAGRILSDPELENGSCRYKVETKTITVIIAFRQPNHVAVITAWRN